MMKEPAAGESRRRITPEASADTGAGAGTESLRGCPRWERHRDDVVSRAAPGLRPWVLGLAVSSPGPREAASPALRPQERSRPADQV